MKLIATATITGSPANIEFTSIPQTFTDLVILISAKGSAAGTAVSALVMQVNGTGGGSERVLRGDGSSVISFSDTSGQIGVIQRVGATGFGSVSCYITNYTSATAKSVSTDSVSENNATLAYQSLNAMIPTTTAAITSLLFGDGSAGGGLAVGSTASLYGILKGSDGIVTTS